MNNEDVAILVLSCDKYSDIWAPFYALLFRYWPECPFKIYNASNYHSFSDSRVTNIHSHQISNWSTETKAILKQIPEKYVLIILEDYFINKPVDNKALMQAIHDLKQNDAMYLRLCCFPEKYTDEWWQYDKMKENPSLGKVRHKQLYRANLQAGIWNRELLYNLIVDGETPWQFEANGSKRSDSFLNPFLCLIEDPKEKYAHGPITYLCTAVLKGVWMRDAIALCKKEKIEIQIDDRVIETKFNYYYRRIHWRAPLIIQKYLDYIKRFLTS